MNRAYPVVTHSPRISCRCEERSDAAIQKGPLNQSAGLLRFARNDSLPWLWVTTG